MAKLTKQDDDIQKAVKHLITYSRTQAPWPERFADFSTDVLNGVEEALNEADMPAEEAGWLWPTLEQADLLDMVLPFILEHFLLTETNEEDETVVEEFIRRRAWREKPIAKRYLQDLSRASLGMWEVTHIKPGSYVDVCAYGVAAEAEPKTIRVFDTSVSNSAQQGIILVTRLLYLDNKPLFSGALLPLTAEDAQFLADSYAELPELLIETTEQEGLTLGKEDALGLQHHMRQERLFNDALVLFCQGALFTNEAAEAVPND